MLLPKYKAGLFVSSGSSLRFSNASTEPEYSVVVYGESVVIGYCVPPGVYPAVP